MRIFAILLPLILGSASAQASKTSWPGVWSGTLGDAPIVMCIQHRDYGDSAAYYYRKHLAIITLSVLDKAGDTSERRFSEGYDSDKKPDAPRLTLSVIDDTHLAGVWQKSANSQAAGLKIALSRLPVAADDNPCSSLAFNTPRATPIRIARKAAKLDNVAYTTLTVDVGKHFDVAIDSFELAGNSPAIKRVNAALRSEIPADPLNSNYFECVTGTLASSGLEGSYSVSIRPALISRSFMVSAESQGGYCGGAHPYHGIKWRNWDLRSGETINPWDWFAAAAVSQVKKDAYTDMNILPPLRKMLTKKWKATNPEPDCAFVGEETNYWDLRLTRKGISFYPQLAHVMTACGDDIDFSFAELNPLLGPAGKKAMAEFRADLTKR